MNRRSFVSEMGVNLFEKTSQVDIPIVDLYSGSPFAVSLKPIHAFKSAAATFLFFSIGAVLTACAGPQIVPPVVQSLPIPVVNFIKVQSCTFCNYTVHQDSFLIRSFRDSRQTHRVVVKSVPGTTHFYYMPFPLHEEVVVNSVNDCELTLRKWNEAGSCIHVSYSEGRFCLTDESTFRSPFNQN